jgi:glycosyltransferase involved in cell wall biosynthesis
MKKIDLYVLGDYKTQSGNGVNEYVYQLAHLMKDEIQVHFINFDLEGKDAYQLQSLENGIRIHSFGKTQYKHLVFPKRFRQWLAAIPKNALFHLHSVFRLENFTLARLLTEAQIAYVFTPHDSYSKASLKTNYILKKIFLLTFEKYILDRAKLVHAITSEGVKCISVYTRNRIKLVTNFVADHSRHFIPHSPQNTICFIGRYDVFQKGLDLQLQAYRKFRDAFSGTVPFILIGNDRKGQLKELRSMCRDLNLREEEDVFFKVNVSDAEKYQLLAGSKVYMQLSRFEGFGLSVVEALTFHKPVIITRNVPTSSIIEAYRAGFVVHSPEEAARALQTIYSYSREQYQKMAQNARTCYLENFYPDLIKPQLMDLYMSSMNSVYEGQRTA